MSLFQISHAVVQAIELAGKIHQTSQPQSQHANKKRPDLQPAYVCHVFHIFRLSNPMQGRFKYSATNALCQVFPS